jgi:serine/threonine protein kinase
MAGLQGRTLGGYQLTKQIASAGIAEVYQARPVAANGHEVVIKVIYPEFARYPSFLPNFQHIVQTAARLASHPHILPVVASGDENGYFYLATPYVADGTLRDWIARGGRLGVSDAGPFFYQLCSALAYAHSLSLTHGNLKPSNVFLYEGRHVMLGDFGMLWDIRQLDMNHSGSGVDVVEYLAPESFAGQFTQHSDIYSLGAMLFATLTGRPPFSGAKPADLRDAHANYPPPRLAQVDPSLPSGVQALDGIIQQAMAKRPEERFPSAMAMAQAIDAVLKQQPAAPPVRALPPAQPMSPPMAQPAPQSGWQQPGVPNSWATPGPVQPSLPAGAAISPLDPPFPLTAPQPPSPAAQGWPASPASEGVQYTERVPAPPVARPLLSQPQSRPANNALALPPAPGTGESWGPTYAPAGGDDPDWRPDAWPSTNNHSQGYNEYGMGNGQSHRQAARDDDWRLAHNSPSRVAQNDHSADNYPSGYADQRLALRDDWASNSQSGLHSQALRYRGDFSATELGLPRLTNPALQGELPPEWEDLLADEALPRRSDIEGDPSQRRPPARRNQPDSFAYSSVAQPYTENRPTAGVAGRRGRPANDGYSFEQPAARPGQRGQPMPTLASAHVPAYGGRRQKPPRQPARREDDDLRRRRWPSVLSVIALLALLVAGAGVVLAKPESCPGTLCTQANSFLHSHLSFLGAAPNANVLHASPGALQVHAVAGSSTNLNVQVSNSGTDSAVWHASADVPWLTISPSRGTLAAGATMTLSVVAMPVNVVPGNYSALLTVASNETSIRIPVSAAVASGPKLKLPAGPLNVTQCNVTQSFKLTNSGDEPLTFTATASDKTVLQLTTASASGSVDGGASATVSFKVNCSAFFNDYAINITSNGGNGTVTVHYSA